MKNYGRLWVLFVCFISAGFAACPADVSVIGNGSVVSRERAATGFNSIALDGIGDVNVHFSENYKVVVTTDSNVQDIVVIKVKNNVLHIDENSVKNIYPTKLKVDVYLPNVKMAALNGVGNINIGSGEGEEVKLYLRGIGDITSYGYHVKKALVDLNGSGNIKVWAADSIRGNLSGMGNIFYKGDPKKHINIRGVGKIKQI